jgi:hypothetical protein
MCSTVNYVEMLKRDTNKNALGGLVKPDLYHEFLFKIIIRKRRVR